MNTNLQNSLIKQVLQLLVVGLCMLSSQVYAWTSVTILTTNDSTAVNAFVKELKEELITKRKTKVNVSKTDSGIRINIPKDTLLIAVGTQALTYASNLSNTTPVIGVLVPKLNYENILKESNRDSNYFSAIYLDQPFTRQLALIKSIFPNTNELGVLLGPVSQFESNDLQIASKQFNIGLNIKLVNKENELQSNLEALMLRKQILLAIPDPLIYNRDTAQTILITSYRHQTPVIGFSQSYVNSGAIAAVFTSPKQFANDIANMIDTLPNERFKLPAPRAPEQFSIQVNYQVARSLDINVPNESTLYQKVLENLN